MPTLITPSETTLPTPLTAYIGLLSTGVQAVRRLPQEALRLPITSLNVALTATAAMKSEYDELTQRGEQAVQALLGRFGKAERNARAAVTELTEVGREVGSDVAREVVRPLREVTEPLLEPAATALDALSAPGDDAAEEIRAVLDPFELPEEVADELEEVTPGAELAHDDLPLADYDHMTLGSLRARIRSLDVPQLVQLRDYERAHADRLSVLTMFDNRIAKLAQDAPAAGGI